MSKFEVTENRSRNKAACNIFVPFGGMLVNGEYDPELYGVYQIAPHPPFHGILLDALLTALVF